MLPELGDTFPCKPSVSNEKRERDGEKKKGGGEIPPACSSGHRSKLGLTPSQGVRKLSPRSQPGAWGTESRDQSLS